MREQIIGAFKSAFLEDERVNALWLEGADGLGRADEYSDIDVWMDAEDGCETEILDAAQRLLESFGELDYVCFDDRPQYKIYQRNMHIKGTSEFLLIDVCVQSRSRGSVGSTFVEGDVAELPLVLFDKIGVIKIIPQPVVAPSFFSEEMRKNDDAFNQRSRLTKYLRRGLFLEAFAYYNKYVCRPLVSMLRLIYTPRHTDYGLVHISAHFPHEIVAELERIHGVRSVREIEESLPAADALYDFAKKTR